MTDFLLWFFHGVQCRLHLFAVAQVSFSSHAFTDCLAMSCGMTSQTSKSFSSWPAVYRWRWRNEDLMWHCVADIDRHLFRRHCGQNAAACNFGFYSCIWVQLLFIVVPAVDCGGKTCELVWACLSCMMLMLHALGMSFVPELRYFQMFKYSTIFTAMGIVLYFSWRSLTPYAILRPFPVMSLKLCRIDFYLSWVWKYVETHWIASSQWDDEQI